MAKGAKKELTTEEIKKNAIHAMLESLIAGKSDEAGEHLHDYLQIKTREVILGEKDDDKDEDSDDDDKDEDSDDDDKDEDSDDDDKDDKKNPFAKKSKKDDDKDSDDDDKDDKKKGKKGKKEKVDEQTRASAFSRSGSIISDKIAGKVKFENGGKKTLKKHGNASKELDDDKVGKTKFKSGGKQPMKTLEKTPKPEKFDDGRDKALGTTKA